MSVFSAHELLNSSTGEVGNVNLPFLSNCEAVQSQKTHPDNVVSDKPVLIRILLTMLKLFRKT
jgi:hypothetical protein